MYITLDKEDYESILLKNVREYIDIFKGLETIVALPDDYSTLYVLQLISIESNDFYEYKDDDICGYSWISIEGYSYEISSILQDSYEVGGLYTTKYNAIRAALVSGGNIQSVQVVDKYNYYDVVLDYIKLIYR